MYYIVINKLSVKVSYTAYRSWIGKKFRTI